MSSPVDDYLSPPRFEVRSAVQRALAEDLTPLGDLTSVLVPDDAFPVARFRARQPAVLAGVEGGAGPFPQVRPLLPITRRRRRL